MAQTFSLFAMVTVHVADVDGVQFDDHPPKVEPTAVRVTDEPRTKLPVQEAVRDGKVTPPLLFSVNVAFAVTVLPLVGRTGCSGIRSTDQPFFALLRAYFKVTRCPFARARLRGLRSDSIR
jgi:hypothetical protein